MSTVIETLDDYLKILNALPKKEKMYVSSYNIGKWLTNGPTFKTLKILNERNANLLIGVPKFRSCIPTYGSSQGMCTHCLKSHHKVLKRMAKLRKTWKNINWTFVRQVHSKMVICGDYVLLGSRNISDSDGKEIVIIIENEKLSNRMLKSWTEYSKSAYDIGTDAPLVFIKPLFGEIMADSSDFTEEMKRSFIEETDNSATRFWKKEEWFNEEDADNDAPF